MRNPHERKRLHCFGRFALDAADRVLLENGIPVALQPKAVELLILLVLRRPAVVTKEEMLDALWPGTAVEESNLTQNVYVLRKALGKDPQTGADYIQTIPKRGYRFAVDVEERPPAAPATEASPVAAPRAQPRLVAAFSIAIVTLTALLLLAWRSRTVDDRAVFRDVAMEKVTNSGTSTVAAVSPDGRYVMYAVERGALQSLWLRELGTDGATEVAPPAAARYIGITFSHDGKHVYCVAYDNDRIVSTLFRMPTLGGPQTILTRNVDTAVSLSPDGQQLAFIVHETISGEDQLIVTDSEGKNPRKLTKRAIPDAFFTPGGLTWSPDGRTIVLADGTVAGRDERRLMAVDVASGAERPLFERTWRDTGPVRWMPDGKALVLTAAIDPASTARQVLMVGYPDGQTRELTSDLSDYRGLSISADGRSIITTRSEGVLNIWISGDGMRDTQITHGGSQYFGVSWMPDGRIVYGSMENGARQIWIMNADGSGRRQLTTGGEGARFPAVSPDGRYVAYSADGDKPWELWRIDIDGAHSTRLVSGPAAHACRWTPDGSALVFSADDPEGGEPVIWKVPAAGGVPQQITKTYSDYPVVSPDGRYVAAFHHAKRADKPWTIALFSLADGRLVRELPVATEPIVRRSPYSRKTLQWTSTGDAVTYIVNRDGAANVWRVDVDGGEPQQMTRFPSQSMFDFAWSRDERRVVAVRGDEIRNVVVLRSVDASRASARPY